MLLPLVQTAACPPGRRPTFSGFLCPLNGYPVLLQELEVFTFLHVADIHLDSPLLKLEHYEGAPVEALRYATLRAFENLVELAIAEGVLFILIAVDLYDGDWKDS